MGGLLGDAERIGDLAPGPALADRLLYGASFQLVGQAAQSDHRSEGCGRVVGMR